MKIQDLTEHEADICKGNCGFTYREWDYFVLKRRDFSNIAIAEKLFVSVRTVERLSKNVKNKVKKVL